MDPKAFLKRILIEGGLLLALLLVLGGAAYYASGLFEEYEREKNGVSGELGTVTSDLSTRRDKFERVKTNRKLYTEIQKKNAANELSLDRELLRKKFDEFKNKFYLDNLKMSLAAGPDLNDGRYKRPIANIVNSEVTVTFEAMNDEDAYAFLQATQNEIPGAARINQFQLTRINKMTIDGLRTISQTGRLSMVKGTVKFTWFGLKPNETQNAPKPTP